MSLATDQIIGWVKDKFQWNKNFQEASSFGQSFGVPDVNLNSIQHSYFSADLQFKYGAQWPGLAEVLGNALELDSALRRDLFGGNDLRYDTYKDL